VLQCVAVCCSVLQFVAVCVLVLCASVWCVLQCVAVCCGVHTMTHANVLLQTFAVGVSVLQCAAVCCNVLQYARNDSTHDFCEILIVGVSNS